MNPFKAPLLPLKGVLRLGQVIKEEAEREMADPARVRRELEETQRLRASGEITEDEAAQMEDEAVSRYIQVRRRPAPAADEEGDDRT